MTKRDFERLLKLRKVAKENRHGTANKYDVVRITARKYGHQFTIGSYVTILFQRSSTFQSRNRTYLAVNNDPETVKCVEAQGSTYSWGGHCGYSAYYIQEDEFEVIYNEEVEE